MADAVAQAGKRKRISHPSMHASVACCLSALIIASLIRFAPMHDATMHGACMVPPGPVVPWTRTAYAIRAGMDHAWIIRTTCYVLMSRSSMYAGPGKYVRINAAASATGQTATVQA